MHRFGSLAIIGSLLGCATLAPCATSGDAAKVIAHYMDMPAAFEANAGQAPGGIDFVSIGLRHTLYLSRSGATLGMGSNENPSVVRMEFARSTTSKAEGLEPLAAKSSHLAGFDSGQWIRDIAMYKRVRYEQVWPGIDVVYYGNQKSLEYDVVVAPGADPARAALNFTGAKRIRTDAHGDLLIETAAGTVVQRKPVAYQRTAAGRREVAARYVVHGNRAVFALGKYDRSTELIIDPVIVYSIPLVISSGFTGSGVAVDGSGNAYFTGTTIGLTLSNGFWASYDPFGNLRFTGTFNSQGPVVGNAIAVDNSGIMYLTGYLTAAAGTTGFPVNIHTGFQQTAGGGQDAYLLKVQYVGGQPTVPYGTYLGGSGNDVGNAVVVDNSGNAYVAGSTSSPNFPSQSGPLASGGGTDGFIAKLNTNLSMGASMSYAFLVGGNGNDSVQGEVLDKNNNLYLAGSTTSTNFTPTGPSAVLGYDTTKTTGTTDGFLMKIPAASPSITYFTFYPLGPFSAISADAAGNAYLTGTATGSIQTNAINGGPQLAGGPGHAFLTRFNTTASGVNSFVYVTYLAGSGTDNGNGVAADSSGNAFVVGQTTSPNFPLAGSPLATTLNGPSDAFISKVNTNTTSTASLVFSSYFGGSSSDMATGVALTAYGNPVFTGTTTSGDFPKVGGGIANGGNQSPFGTKLAFEGVPFGNVDTPTNGTTNVSGAVGVTGWALSPIGVANVGIWRDPIAGEQPAPNGLVFVANTSLIPGSRPDIMSQCPTCPNNNWGWGLQVLTNELPGTGGKPLGNGTYNFHALATDNDGLTADIGHTSITVTNSTSLLPFGTIDTPATGATISGSMYTNFGWVVTPLPATIPKDGSTITVYIDNVAVGHPVYNNYRADIATLFPGLNNSGTVNQPQNGGAIGYFYIDTTKLSNGLHTISWNVLDNAGHATGIGSRFFNVQN